MANKKIGPVDIEFRLGGKADAEAKQLKETIDQVGGSGKKSAADLRSAMAEQKNIIAQIEKDIKDIERKSAKVAPGKAKLALIKDSAAAKQALEEEKAALSDLDIELKKNASSTQRLETYKRRLMESLAEAELAGKRGTAEYAKQRVELARLSNALKDASAQERILANDYGTLQGIMSGVSGITGIFSAGAGAVGIFADENENLQKIQTRVQSLMAVTIGLQQTLNVLNKDSYFRIITVNQVTKAWNKSVLFLNESLGINIALSKAMVATGIGLIIAAIGALVYAFKQYEKRMEETNRLKNEFIDISNSAAKEVAKEKVQIDSLLTVAKSYTANLDTRKKAITKLNEIMPGYNGYIDQEGRLIDNSNTALKSYLDTLIKVERAKQIMDKLATAEGSLDALKTTGAGAEPSFIQKLSAGIIKDLLPNKYIDVVTKYTEENISKTQADLNKSIAAYKKQLDALLTDSGVFETLFGTKDSKGSKKEYDAEAALQRRLLELQQRTSQILFDQRQDSIEKRLSQTDKEYQAELDSLNEFEKEVIKKYNETNKDKKGFKPLSTADNKVQSSIAAIDPEIAKKFQEELTNLTYAYQQKRNKIVEDGTREIQKILKGVSDQYQDEQQKELQAVREKYSKIRDEIFKYQGYITDAQRNVIQKAQDTTEQTINDTWAVKTNDAFVTLFGELDRVSTRTLKSAIERARQIVQEKAKSLDPADLKSFMDAINNAERQIRERNPFTALIDSIKDYKKAASEAEKDNAMQNMAQQAQATADVIMNSMNQVVGALQEVGLVTDEQADTIKNIQQAVKGAGTLAAGIATENPMQIIQGSIDLIISGIKLADTYNKRIEKDIEETKKRIDNLKYSYQQLQYAVENALGTDVFSKRASEISNLQQQITEQYRLINDELNKTEKKQDDSAIAAAKDSIQQLQQEINDIKQQIFEDVTQTNAKSLADDLASAIVNAWQKGEDAAKSYEEVSTRVLQNAVKNALKMQLLEKPIQQAVQNLMKDMGSFDQNGVFKYDELTKKEGDNFKKNIESIGSSYADALKGLDWLFPAADQIDKSLTGSIQGVSEKTASALGGQINAIRVNAAETKDIVKQQLQHLANIDSNTHNSKNRLEDILKILESMNNNSLRSEGL